MSRPGGIFPEKSEFLKKIFVLWKWMKKIYLILYFLLKEIKTVIAGESKIFAGAEEFMESKSVKMIDLNLSECKQLMRDFISANPALWNEDIGVD
jgi:hypothetical protein